MSQEELVRSGQLDTLGDDFLDQLPDDPLDSWAFFALDHHFGYGILALEKL